MKPISDRQVEERLKKASMEYIRHGQNRTEVEFYARLFRVLQEIKTQSKEQ